MNEHQQPGSLVRDYKLTGEDIYTWVELGYTTRDYPGLPQYYHEFVRLAPISDYKAWSPEQRQNAVRAIREQKEMEFRQKYGSEAPSNATGQNRGIPRILEWLRKRFR